MPTFVSDISLLAHLLAKLSEFPLIAESLRSFFLSLPSELSRSLGGMEVSDEHLGDLSDRLRLSKEDISCFLFTLSGDRYLASVLWDACALHLQERTSSASEAFGLLTSQRARDKIFNSDMRPIRELSTRDFWYSAQRIMRSEPPCLSSLQVCYLQSPNLFNKRQLPNVREGLPTPVADRQYNTCNRKEQVLSEIGLIRARLTQADTTPDRLRTLQTDQHVFS